MVNVKYFLDFLRFDELISFDFVCKIQYMILVYFEFMELLRSYIFEKIIFEYKNKIVVQIFVDLFCKLLNIYFQWKVDQFLVFFYVIKLKYKFCLFEFLVS